MPTPVIKLYAETQRCKQLWADTHDLPTRDLYLSQGRLAGDAMSARRASTLNDVLLKLAELEEWIQDDVTVSARVLLQSVIADVEAFRDGGNDPVPVEPSPHRPGPVSEAAVAMPRARRAVPRVALTPVVVKVDRRMRPVQIGDVIYPSVSTACRSLGISPAQVDRLSTTN